MALDRLFKGLTGRLIVLILCFWSLLGLLIYRLWDVQLRLGVMHQKSISKQSIRRIRVAPIRGRIISSDGNYFTDNTPSYDAVFHLHELRAADPSGRNDPVTGLFDTINETALLIGREHDISIVDIRRHFYIYPVIPFRAFPDLSKREMSILFEQIPRTRGLEIATRMKRSYPQQEVGAHLIGFVGNKDPNKEEERRAYSYFLPELTGRSGLERLYDDRLKGRGGALLVQVDSMGFFHEELTTTDEAATGNDVVLTINSRAQRIAQELLGDRRGAFVLVDCNTGAVLALASSPSYDLNKISTSYYSKLVNDSENIPLLNRAISGGYAPGSIVKPIVAAALLQERIYGVEEEYICDGHVVIGNGKIGCSHHASRGIVDVLSALESSCNSYFINGGLNFGIDRLMIYYHNAGVGRDLGLEIKTRGSAGLLPSRREKSRRRGAPWNAFDTGLVSIGQGLITISPLHAAMFTAAIANGGKLYRPSLIRTIKDSSGFYVDVFRPEVIGSLDIKPEILDIVKEGMVRVIHGDDGTGAEAATPTIQLAGKTGTAEVGSGKNKRNDTWFIAYGPLEAPKYAVAVLVEDGISGGKTSAPIVRKFFDEFLSPATLSHNGS